MRYDSELIRRVDRFISAENLMTHEGLHLVALSGGADSVALLLILIRLGYHVEAVHCNFRLRGEESDRDENFVKDLCKNNNVPLHLIHFDTEEYALAHQVSIEMAARELRYRYFGHLCEDVGAETVCVAHHRDDAVETLLMNLLRGSGIHGLTGIRPRNGYVVRPLLCANRSEIEQMLKDAGQPFVTDSTNLKADVLRNKIRLRLMPLLKELNTAAPENIMRSASYLSEAEKVYDAFLKPLCDTNELSISELKDTPSPLCLLHEWLTPLGFNRSQVADILASSCRESGREFVSSSHSLVVDRDRLVVSHLLAPMKPLKMPEQGLYKIDETASLRVEIIDGPFLVSREASVCTLESSVLKFPLTLRRVQEGDRFQPFGMKGSKLVSDFLTDHKLSVHEKRRQMVVTDALGRIIWVVGLRAADFCRVTTDTRSIIRMTYQLNN